MASSENSFMSERSQAYIFRKQKFKVSQIMKVLCKSKNWVIKLSISGETGEVSRRKGSGRPIGPPGDKTCLRVSDKASFEPVP